MHFVQTVMIKTLSALFQEQTSEESPGGICRSKSKCPEMTSFLKKESLLHPRNSCFAFRDSVMRMIHMSGPILPFSGADLLNTSPER